MVAPGAPPAHEVFAPPPALNSSEVHMCELEVAQPMERATWYLVRDGVGGLGLGVWGWVWGWG